MEQILWTFEDVVRFVDHPDRPLRSWAAESLTKRFPERADEVLIGMLDDGAWSIANRAINFLARSGAAERYGPILFERLERSRGDRLGLLARALARLDYRAALPAILEIATRAGPGSEKPTVDESLYLASALGDFGGPEARRVLWRMLETTSGDHYWDATVIDALLKAAMPEDVAMLMRVYRSWGPSPRVRRHLEAFAGAVGASRLVEAVRRASRDGLDAVLERVAIWLGQYPDLSDECEAALASAFRRRHQGSLTAMRDEAHRLLNMRGDALDAWLAEWHGGERPVGYRRRALLALLMLDELADNPSRSREQRANEAGFGLALLCQLSVDRNDRLRLEQAEDRAGMLLTILTEYREHVLPDIVERVAALGPEIVPRLVAKFDPEGFGWGPIRTARVVERVAHRHPGSCDAAIPVLIQAINDRQGDFLLEACSDALGAIGPAAVEPIAERLRDDDIARRIYLTGVLREIPTEGAAQAILSWMADSHPVEEMHVYGLAEIGSPSAIEPLYELWKSGSDLDRFLAECLLVLCLLNNVPKPELDEWRQIVVAEDARLDRMLEPLSAASGTGARVAKKRLVARPTGKRKRGKSQKRKRRG